MSHLDTPASVGIKDGGWVRIEAPEGRVQMRGRVFDGLAPDVVGAQHAWKASSASLLFGERAGYDPEAGAESLRSTLCAVSRVAKGQGAS